MRHLLVLFSILVLTTTAPAQELPKNLNEALKSFQSAKDANDKHAMTFFAEHAFTFANEQFGASNPVTADIARLWMQSFRRHNDGRKNLSLELVELAKLYDQTKAVNSPKITTYYKNLASFLVSQNREGHFEERRRAYTASSEILEYYVNHHRHFYPEDKIGLVNKYIDIGIMAYGNTSYREAKKHFKSAKDIIQAADIDSPHQEAVLAFWDAKQHLTNSKFEKAEKSMLTAIGTFDTTNPAGQMALASHAFMVEILSKQGRDEEATEHCLMIGRQQAFDVNAEQKPLYRIAPKYPSGAFQRHKTGWVLMEFTIDASGIVRNPKAIDGENKKLFAKAAEDALIQYRYAPRFIDGKPVATEGMQIIFRFEM